MPSWYVTSCLSLTLPLLIVLQYLNMDLIEAPAEKGRVIQSVKKTRMNSKNFRKLLTRLNKRVNIFLMPKYGLQELILDNAIGKIIRRTMQINILECHVLFLAWGNLLENIKSRFVENSTILCAFKLSLPKSTYKEKTQKSPPITTKCALISD